MRKSYKFIGRYFDDLNLLWNTSHLLIALAAPFLISTYIAYWGVVALPDQSATLNPVVDRMCSNFQLLSSTSPRIYTGIFPMDKLLCILVEIFTLALSPPAEKFTQNFLLSLPTLVLVILLEGAREDRPWFVVPLLWGLLYQVCSIGLIVSIMWFPLVLEYRRGKATLPVTRTHAEGAFVALLLGYYVPTFAMLVTKHHIAIALWQLFPLYISVVQFLWPRLRGKARETYPAFTYTALEFTIVTAALTHLYYLYTVRAEITFSSIYQWLPAWHLVEGSRTTPIITARSFLQYDALTAYGTTIIAGLLLLGPSKRPVLWVIFSFFITVIFGPAAYIGILWIRREGGLHAIIISQKIKSADEILARIRESLYIS